VVFSEACRSRHQLQACGQRNPFLGMGVLEKTFFIRFYWAPYDECSDLAFRISVERGRFGVCDASRRAEIIGEWQEHRRTLDAQRSDATRTASDPHRPATWRAG